MLSQYLVITWDIYTTILTCPPIAGSVDYYYYLLYVYFFSRVRLGTKLHNTPLSERSIVVAR
jgi:hypothetical protein